MSERQPRAAGVGARAGSWIVICFLLLPLTIVFPISVTDQNFLSLPVDGVSLRHYANLFSSTAWLSSIGQSLVIALSSMAISVTAGTLCAIGCWRRGSRASEAIRVLMLVPLIVPSIVYALGLYRLWIQLRLLDTYTGIIIAHAVTAIPYVIIIVSTALAGVDVRLEQAARNLGANLRQTLWMVLIPNILPAIVSSAIFAFIHSWDEAVIVLFIAGRNMFTLPRRMWDGINDKLDPTMAAVAAVLIVLTAALLLVDLLLKRRR
ncbi:MAG TPA: ABC transporter permease [Stellaceae bacterium]|nr:ABC transporter permease [Stellaceae bacterium]